MSEYDTASCPILKASCLRLGCVFWRDAGCTFNVTGEYVGHILTTLTELRSELQGIQYRLDSIEHKLNR